MKIGHILRQTTKIIFLAALVACNTPPEGNDSTEATQPATKLVVKSPTVLAEQDWVIITRGQAEEMGIGAWLAESDDFWTPSENDISMFEKAIAEYLSQNSTFFYRQPPAWERLEEYQRQFIGLMRNGSHIIYGNYFCDNLGISWRQKLVIVEDGGDCFFQVEYDIERGMFIKLLVNGES